MRSAKPEDLLNAGLTKLYLDEEVVDAIVDETGRDCKTIWFLIDKNRLIITSEDQYESGFLMMKYNHYGYAYDLSKVDFSKSTINVCKENKIFGISYEIVILRYQNEKGELQEITVSAPINKGKDQLKKIKKHYDKYSKTETSVKKGESKKEKSTQSSVVNDIRKLYEDGIITRDEMLDLLKDAVKK